MKQCKTKFRQKYIFKSICRLCNDCKHPHPMFTSCSVNKALMKGLISSFVTKLEGLKANKHQNNVTHCKIIIFCESRDTGTCGDA